MAVGALTPSTVSAFCSTWRDAESQCQADQQADDQAHGETASLPLEAGAL